MSERVYRALTPYLTQIREDLIERATEGKTARPVAYLFSGGPGSLTLYRVIEGEVGAAEPKVPWSARRGAVGEVHIHGFMGAEYISGEDIYAYLSEDYIFYATATFVGTGRRAGEPVIRIYTTHDERQKNRWRAEALAKLRQYHTVLREVRAKTYRSPQEAEVIYKQALAEFERLGRRMQKAWSTFLTSQQHSLRVGG